MRFKCVKCGRYDNGPVKAHRICPACKYEMVPVVTTTENGKEKEKILNLFEEGRT